MEHTKAKNTGYLKPSRLSFPIDAKVYDWLPPLLEAYYIMDKGIAEAIKRETKKGRKLACGKECSSCCKTHQTMPVYPLELVGISWYVRKRYQVQSEKHLKVSSDLIKKMIPAHFYCMVPAWCTPCDPSHAGNLLFLVRPVLRTKTPITQG